MNKSSKSKYTGRCLCGSVVYEIDGLEPNMAHCHCSMCRKFHGSAFATFGEAKKENFRFIAGEENLKSYVGKNNTTRQFCINCGSSLIFIPSEDNGKFVEFSLGTLDSEIDLKPDAHIYVGSKAKWYEINDELPKYFESRDSSIIES